MPIQFFINLSIALIMLGIGLELKFDDFKRVITHPRDIITGLFCQLILLPIIAFIIVMLVPMQPAYKVGFMIIAAVPGGTSSNLVTHLLKGRTALSVSLTSLNSFIIILSVPLIVNLSMDLFMKESSQISLDVSRTLSAIGFPVVLPVLIGIIINEFTSDNLSEKIEGPLRIILPVLMVFLILLGMAGEQGVSPSRIWQNLDLLIPLVILNMVAIVTGYLIARCLLKDSHSWYTIGIETGLQNSALAIYVAASLIGNIDMKLMALLYASFSFFTTFSMGWALKRLKSF